MYLDGIRDSYPFEWFNIEKDKEHKEHKERKSNERKMVKICRNVI